MINRESVNKSQADLAIAIRRIDSILHEVHAERDRHSDVESINAKIRKLKQDLMETERTVKFLLIELKKEKKLQDEVKSQLHTTLTRVKAYETETNLLQNLQNDIAMISKKDFAELKRLFRPAQVLRDLFTGIAMLFKVPGCDKWRNVQKFIAAASTQGKIRRLKPEEVDPETVKKVRQFIDEHEDTINRMAAYQANKKIAPLEPWLRVIVSLCEKMVIEDLQPEEAVEQITMMRRESQIFTNKLQKIAMTVARAEATELEVVNAIKVLIHEKKKITSPIVRKDGSPIINFSKCPTSPMRTRVKPSSTRKSAMSPTSPIQVLTLDTVDSRSTRRDLFMDDISEDDDFLDGEIKEEGFNTLPPTHSSSVIEMQDELVSALDFKSLKETWENKSEPVLSKSEGNNIDEEDDDIYYTGNDDRLTRISEELDQKDNSGFHRMTDELASSEFLETRDEFDIGPVTLDERLSEIDIAKLASEIRLHASHIDINVDDFKLPDSKPRLSQQDTTDFEDSILRWNCYRRQSIRYKTDVFSLWQDKGASFKRPSKKTQPKKKKVKAEIGYESVSTDSAQAAPWLEKVKEMRTRREEKPELLSPRSARISMSSVSAEELPKGLPDVVSLRNHKSAPSLLEQPRKARSKSAFCRREKGKKSSCDILLV